MPGIVGLITSGSKVVSSSTSTLEIIHFAVAFNEKHFPCYRNMVAAWEKVCSVFYSPFRSSITPLISVMSSVCLTCTANYNILWLIEPFACQEKKKQAPAKPSDVKRTRRDRTEMENIIFKLFERQPNWALKALVQETDQPEVFPCLFSDMSVGKCI